MKKNWKLILILWSSWVWKWTLVSLLKERKNSEKYFFPVSCTTRKPRLINETWEFEKHWVDYYFLSNEEFEEKIENWELLEYAHVHWKTYYWLPKTSILDAISEWKIVIREADVQGFDSVSKILEKEIFWSIFIDIPEIELLKNRIRNRAEISEEELNSRIKSIEMEREYKEKADFFIKNIEDWIEEMYEDLLEKIEELIK